MIKIFTNNNIKDFFKKILKFKLIEGIIFDSENKYIFLYYSGPIYVRILDTNFYQNFHADDIFPINASFLYKAINAIKSNTYTLSIDKSKLSIKDENVSFSLKSDLLIRCDVQSCFKKFFCTNNKIIVKRKYFLYILNDISTFISKVDNIENFFSISKNENNFFLETLITDGFIFFMSIIKVNDYENIEKDLNSCISLSKRQISVLNELITIFDSEEIYFSFNNKQPLNVGDYKFNCLILHSIQNDNIFHTAKNMLNQSFALRIYIKDPIYFKNSIISLEKISKLVGNNFVNEIIFSVISDKKIKIYTYDESYIEFIEVNIKDKNNLSYNLNDNDGFIFKLSTISLFRITSFKSLFEDILYIDFLNFNQPVLFKCNDIEENRKTIIGLMPKN